MPGIGGAGWHGFEDGAITFRKTDVLLKAAVEIGWDHVTKRSRVIPYSDGYENQESMIEQVVATSALAMVVSR